MTEEATQRKSGENVKVDASTGFQMHYSARERKTYAQEIERIRSQYTPHGLDLDESVSSETTSGKSVSRETASGETASRELISGGSVSEESGLDEAAKREDELERLRKLDEKAKTPALVVALSLGVGGALILGLGLSMCLAMDLMALGIVIGVLGMAILSLAFPVHQHMLKKGKEKYGAQIQEFCQTLEK